MNKKEELTTASIVKEVLEQHPQTLQVFMDIGLLCAGCPTEAFHTLADVAREYHLDLDRLLLQLNEIAKENKV